MLVLDALNCNEAEMGICASVNRSTVSDDDVSRHGNERPRNTGSPNSRGSSRTRSTALLPLSPRSPSREAAALPYEAVEPLSNYFDGLTFGRLSLTNTQFSGYLPEARQRVQEEITADVQRANQGFDNQSSAPLRSFRRVRSLSDETRAELLTSAVNGFQLWHADGGMEGIDASRASFASLCGEVREMRGHETFPELASALVNRALLKIYDTGDDWNTHNVAQPLEQALSVVVHLPEGQRRELADFMRNNIVHLIMVDDRRRARNAIDRIAPRRQLHFF